MENYLQWEKICIFRIRKMNPLTWKGENIFLKGFPGKKFPFFTGEMKFSPKQTHLQFHLHFPKRANICKWKLQARAKRVTEFLNLQILLFYILLNSWLVHFMIPILCVSFPLFCSDSFPKNAWNKWFGYGNNRTLENSENTNQGHNGEVFAKSIRNTAKKTNMFCLFRRNSISW